MNKTEDIKNFEDIVKQHSIDRDTLKRINERLANAMGISTDEVKFTSLQIKAFNKEGFWNSSRNFNQHVVIQGATSSGKTLVSEMAILDSLKNGNKRSIVLVPLRAMVRERYEQLKDDLSLQGLESVYPSSSDYQEHDGEIINGDFGVAVIVYEKFFAMLIQSQSKGNGKNIPMLKDCSLLVVDELQMLNSRDRGPKLEIAIQKVLENNKTSDLKTRIMCLTTCDCKVDNIKEWLTINNGSKEPKEPILIQNSERPTDLCEHVIELNGKFRYHHIHSKGTDFSSEKDDGEGEIKIPDAVGRNREIDKKNSLLKKLIEKIYEENPESKVLVYVNGRRKTCQIAKFIADEDLLPVEEMSEKMKQIRDYDEDDYTNALREKLLPRRIAFHNASLSAPLREFIEGLFCDNEEPLKLVVATETLTIGMNMPVDIMILYDSETRRNEGKVRLTVQEYKNFVGRAGRLGNKFNSVGESYVFAKDSNDANYLWNNYVHYRPEEIESSLSDVEEQDLAPYYLNLLIGKEKYTTEDFSKILKESFAKKCTDRKFDADKMLKLLKKAKMCSECEDNDYDDDDEDENQDERSYKLTDFGNYMASYALDLETYKIIRRYFYNGLYMKKKDGGLPTDVKSKDLQEYSLDIFYRLCQTKEVKNIGQLKLPNPNEGGRDSRKILDSIEKTLKNMVESGECELWEDSPIKKMLDENYKWLDEYEEKGYLLRAILLWYWTKGYDLHTIREKTNFKGISIVQEDIARIAETVAYLLEAISKGIAVARDFKNSSTADDLYNFSTCVNYGMPRNLVIIANKHVRTLDRKSILRIGKLWEDKRVAYETPSSFLLMNNENELRAIINEDTHKEIIRKLQESTFHENFELLLKEICNETNLSEVAAKAIQDLYDTDTNENSENLLSPMKYLFEKNAIADEEEPIFKKTTLNTFYTPDNENLLKLSCNEKDFIFIAFNDNAEDLKDYKKCSTYIESTYIENHSSKARVILVLKNEADIQKIEWYNNIGTLMNENGDTIIKNIKVVMTFQQLSFLISQAIKVSDNDAHMLTALLNDTIGEFPQSSLNTLGMLLENFRATTVQDNTEVSSQLPTIRIVCDKRKNTVYNKLIDSLKQQKVSYKIISWGEQLLNEENIADNYYLLFLDWEIVQRMHSLKTFFEKLQKTDYKKTFAIFDSEKNFQKWGGDPDRPCEMLAHCESTKNFAFDIPNKIIPFFYENREYLIGVSYAHASKGVSLLKKFVEKLNKEFTEEKIFFDENMSSQILLHGQGAGKKNPEYYKKCKFFLVLDDKAYDESSPCKEEFQAITERIEELPEIEGCRLWFLNPSGNQHCKYFNNDEDYYTNLTEESIDKNANRFINLVKKFSQSLK